MSNTDEPVTRESLIQQAYERLKEYNPEDPEAIAIAKYIKQMEDNKPDPTRVGWLPDVDTVWKIGASCFLVVTVVVLETSGHSIMTKGIGFVKQLGLL